MKAQRKAIWILCIALTLPLANIPAIETSISVSNALIATGVGIHVSEGRWEGDFGLYTSVISALGWQLSTAPTEPGWTTFRDFSSMIGGEAAFRYVFSRSDNFIFSGGLSLVGVAGIWDQPLFVATLGPQFMFEFPLSNKRDSLFFRSVIPMLIAGWAPKEFLMASVLPPATIVWGGIAGLFFGYRHTF